MLTETIKIVLIKTFDKFDQKVGDMYIFIPKSKNISSL